MPSSKVHPEKQWKRGEINMRQTNAWLDVSLTKKWAHSIRRKSGPKSQINFNDTDDFNKYFIFNYHRQCVWEIWKSALSTNFDGALPVSYTPATLHFMRKMNHFIYEKEWKISERLPKNHSNHNIIKHRSIATKQVHFVWSAWLCEPYEKYIARQCRHLDKYKIHVNSDEYKFPFYFDCFLVMVVAVAVAVVTSWKCVWTASSWDGS